MNNTQKINYLLDSKKTFKNFVEGNSNKLALITSHSIAENLGKSTHNPSLIYGPSGCGKTHLINAIGEYCKENYPQKRVQYINSRQFKMLYTDAVFQNSMNDFINSYQSIDVLIVDDIQEWKHSPKTLDAFCCIFNHMIRNDKQMVLASNCPPVKLQGIDKRLIERFASGVIVEMKKPDEQLCIDILKFKCQNEDLKIPADVIEFVAKTSNGSVCALEGVANSLMATSLALKQKIDIRMAEQIIQSIHS